MKNLDDLRSQVAVCRRELAFRRAELRNQQEFAQSAEQKQQQELLELNARIHAAVAGARDACRQREQEHRALEQAACERGEELLEMHLEVRTSEAELEVACALSRSQGKEWAQCEAARAELEETGGQGELLEEEEQRCAAEARALRAELAASDETCRQRALQVDDLQKILCSREEEVSEYRDRSSELYQELQTLLQGLRAGHEEVRGENRRLEEHVERLAARAFEESREPDRPVEKPKNRKAKALEVRGGRSTVASGRSRSAGIAVQRSDHSITGVSGASSRAGASHVRSSDKKQPK